MSKIEILIGIIVIAIILLLNGKADNDFVKSCTEKGYSESYCMTKA